MKKRISIDEIENMIKNKLKQDGVLEMISQEKISEIKGKIKDILDNHKKLDEQESQQPTSNIGQTVQTQNPNVTVKTTEDPEKTEIIKKETELEIREKELIQKEFELEEKQKQIDKKEEELKYTPEIPQILKSIEPGEIILFDTNELSLGYENLSNRDFRLKSNPDEKKSIKDLWLLSAITKTNVYVVELKKLGTLNFDPYEGTTTFENLKNSEDFIDHDQNLEQSDAVESAVKSQYPKEEMLDSVEPIKDVSMPIMNQNDIEKEKFETNFKDVITKIVSDQLNKISSETTKKNIFSL
jgi:hypothetical protein